VTAPLDEIRSVLQKADIDDSMIFLAHLLAVIRGEASDPLLEHRLSRYRSSPPEFFVRFLAKWLLIEAQEPGLYQLDWPRYKRLQDLFFQIDDPMVGDPDWVNAEPTGFFHRQFTLQLPAQERITTRHIGLALALFRDCGTPQISGEYDLKADLERELGVSIEQFMAMGHLVFCASMAKHRRTPVRGTLTPGYLRKALGEGIEWCVPEIWQPFLDRVACTPQAFRDCRLNRKGYRVDRPEFEQFEFNALERFPIIDVGFGHHIAIDPSLVLKRVTEGLFFDLFERDGPAFSERFGPVLSRLVGELLHSVHPAEALWCDPDEQVSRKGRRLSKLGQRADWAFKGRDFTILFECKALQPTLELRHFGSQKSIDTLRERIVDGLEQAVHQAQAIAQGDWEEHGLPPARVVSALVSYGDFLVLRLPWFRERLQKALNDKGLGGHPFAVLSINELDTVVRLAELGQPMDQFFYRASQQHGVAGLIRALAKMLEGKVTTSSYAHRRNQSFQAKYLPAPTSIDRSHARHTTKTKPRQRRRRRGQ
jgi:hypothetical protein